MNFFMQDLYDSEKCKLLVECRYSTFFSGRDII